MATTENVANFGTFILNYSEEEFSPFKIYIYILLGNRGVEKTG